MDKTERDLLVACGKALKEIGKVVHHIPIPAMNPIDFQELDNATSDIDYCLKVLAEYNKDE